MLSLIVVFSNHGVCATYAIDPEMIHSVGIVVSNALGTNILPDIISDSPMMDESNRLFPEPLGP